MEFEIWWLLSIPIFFGLGWIAARIDIKQLLSESRSLPKGYFKGLNFLLIEQPDKAIRTLSSKSSGSILRQPICILHSATCSAAAAKRNAPSVCTRISFSALTCLPNSKCRLSTNWVRTF